MALCQPRKARSTRTRLDVATGHGELGRVLAALGRTDDAEGASRRAVTLFENLVSDFPDVPSYQAGLVRAMSGLASALQQVHRPQEAVRAAKRAVELSL